MRSALWPDDDAVSLRREAGRFLAGESVTGLDAVLVAECADGRLVGFVELGLRPYVDGCEGSPVPFIEGWFVSEPERRCGIGRALIAAAERWALARNFQEIASDTLLENVVSERAHKALGFDEVERAIRFRRKLPH